MRKTILILFLALWPALAHAQSLTTVASALKGGATLPATCKPATSGSRADVFIKTGSSAGLYTCSAANTWTAVGGSSSSGDVVGPASATDNAVVRFDGTTGKLVQDSAVTIADTTGDITAGKYNKVTITAPATGSTLTILNGKTLTANNTLTLAGTDSTVMTFPSTSATIARTDAANTFTGTQTVGALVATTVNGNTFTAGTYTLTGSAGKTLTFSNTLTLAGTDGSTLNVGAGGTLGSAAFTAASAYEVPLTFSTGLTRSTNTITVDQSFAPTWTGAHIHSNTIAQSSASATAFRSGASSSTPSFQIDNSTSSQASGITVTGKADGTAPDIKVNSRTQITTALAGNGLTITADPAIAGSSVAGAAAGGSITFTAGAAARLTSGNANGGNINLVTGAGIGTGTSGQVLMTALGSNLPSYSFIGNTTYGIGTNGSNLAIWGGQPSIGLNGAAVALAANGSIGFNSTTNNAITTVVDTIIRRAAAANPVFGATDNATPVAYTLTLGESSRGGTDSNVTGANGILRPGNGTGTGGSGSFKIQVAPAGSTGTTANTYADALSIANTKAVTFSGAISGTTANFSGAITVASCTGCGGGTTINASGQGIWIPDVFYDADSFEGVASGNDVKFYRFINPVAVTADRADLKGVVAQASGKFSFSLRSWDCTTTTYFDSGVMDTTSWSNVDVTQTLSSNTLPAGGICLMWTHDNTTSKTRTVGPQANTMAVWNIPASGTKRLGTCSNTSSAGVLPGSCGTETGSNTQGVFQFTLRKN